MPLSYEIDREQRIVLVTLSGRVTEAEVFGYQWEVWSKPENLGFGEMVDLSQVTDVETVTSEKFAELARLSCTMEDAVAETPLAIVAVTPFQFGLARMYQNHRDMVKGSTKIVRLFRSRDEAMEWVVGRLANGEVTR